MRFHVLICPERNGFVYALGHTPEQVAWNIDQYEIMGSIMPYTRLLQKGYHPGIIEMCVLDDARVIDKGYVLENPYGSVYPYFTSSKHIWKEIEEREIGSYKLLRQCKFRTKKTGMRILDETQL